MFVDEGNDYDNNDKDETNYHIIILVDQVDIIIFETSKSLRKFPYNIVTHTRKRPNQLP